MSFPWPTLELPQPLTGLAGGVCALWNQSSPGWVGVDFGVSSIKLAQLEKQGEFWRLKNCAFLPLSAADPDAPQLSGEELAIAAHVELTRSSGLGSIFSTPQAAAVASLGVLDLRSFEARDLDEGETAEPDESLEDTGREMASWELPAHLFHPSRGRQVMSAAMETVAVSQFAEAVAQLGLDCCTLDVLPACLARSLALLGEPATQSAVAVLDLGYGHPSLTLCQEGLPVYSRRLKHCGLGQLMTRLAAEFGLSHEECRALLARFGSCPAEGTQEALGKSFLSTALQTYLGHLKSELIRTLDYLESHRRESFPEQITLCGGGGTIAGVGDWLTGQVGIPAAPWTLAGPAREGVSGDHRLHPLFAAAAALSALAWEA